MESEAYILAEKQVTMKICVYCGSSFAEDEELNGLAKNIGRDIGKNQDTLVYGGANVGLMKLVADGCLEAGGKVIGVMSEDLKSREIDHPNLTELIYTKNLSERKMMLMTLSDAFLTLPGGLGTLDELFETWTMKQIGVVQNPIGLLDYHGHFDALLEHLQHCIKAGFVRESAIHNLIIEDEWSVLYQKLKDSVSK